MDQQVPVISAKNISKRFGAQWALSDVTLTVQPGEIHGLLGQNGCGKSTLIKVLAGFHTPDTGSLEVDGQPLNLPVAGRELREHRLRFVHQDLALVSSLSVADNFNLDQLAAQKALLPARAAGGLQEVEETLNAWGVSVSPTATIATLSRLDRAKVAIVKAVRDFSGDSRGGLLVLDEPTAFLPPDEAQALFATMRRVASTGAGVLFVSHNLDEIMDHTDRATVLRNGRLVGTADIGDSSVGEIVHMILGRDAEEQAPPAVIARGADDTPALTVSDLRCNGINPFELVVYPGEVVGLTGLIGSGFERIPSLLFGAEKADGGTIDFSDGSVELASLNPATAVKAGIGYVPSERLVDATAPSLSIGENVVVLTLDAIKGMFGSIGRRKALAHANELIAPTDVQPRDPGLPLMALSGGNQQKVVLSKWLSIVPRLLLISEPTQGVDIGAREQIAAILRELAMNGCAVVCASSDLDQLTELCSRILVFREGVVVAEVQDEEVNKHNLMLALFSRDDGQRNQNINGTETLS